MDAEAEHRLENTRECRGRWRIDPSLQSSRAARIPSPMPEHTAHDDAAPAILCVFHSSSYRVSGEVIVDASAHELRENESASRFRWGETIVADSAIRYLRFRRDRSGRRARETLPRSRRSPHAGFRDWGSCRPRGGECRRLLRAYVERGIPSFRAWSGDVSRKTSARHSRSAPALNH